MRWPVVPIRRVARLGTGHTPSRQHPEYWENCTIPWLTLADVGALRDGTRTVVTDTKEKISQLGVANSSAVVHPAEAVALSRTASVGFACVLGREMATSQDFAVWTCGPHLLPRYLLYALRADPGQIRERMTGSTHKTIYMPDIETLTTPLPPIAAQQRIADFLEAETARIDTLTGLRARQGAMAEMRIDRWLGDLARGVGLATEWRDSRVDWLGDVPCHWTVARLKFVARIESGHTPSRSNPDLWVDCETPWITLNDVGAMKTAEFLDEPINRISERGLAASSARVLPPGTVVLSRDATVGRVAIMPRSMALAAFRELRLRPVAATEVPVAGNAHSDADALWILDRRRHAANDRHARHRRTAGSSPTAGGAGPDRLESRCGSRVHRPPAGGNRKQRRAAAGAQASANQRCRYRSARPGP